MKKILYEYPGKAILLYKMSPGIMNDTFQKCYGPNSFFTGQFDIHAKDFVSLG